MSDEIRKQLQSAYGILLSRFPELARGWARSYEALRLDDPPLAPLTRPLREVRLALVTTGGVHLDSQPPFDMADPAGDATFRAIPAGTPAEQLRITHDYYDHTDARRDLNILFPIGHMRELVAAGHLGSLATSYGFMGHIEGPHLERLVRETAPQVAGMLKAERVDAALLTPA